MGIRISGAVLGREPVVHIFFFCQVRIGQSGQCGWIGIQKRVCSKKATRGEAPWAFLSRLWSLRLRSAGRWFVATALVGVPRSAGHLLAARLLRVLTFSLVLFVFRVLRRFAAISHGHSPLRDAAEKVKATVAFGYRVGHARRNCLSRRSRCSRNIKSVETMAVHATLAKGPNEQHMADAPYEERGAR